MSELTVSRLLASVTESAPQAIDALAKKYRGEGRPVIAFGAGEPDFDTPAFITEAAKAAIDDPHNHHYSGPSGLPELREAVAEYTTAYAGSVFTANEVAIANGGKQAIYNALSAILNPGDEVLLPAPYWTSYPEQVKLAGGITVPVSTDVDSEYKTTVADLEHARTNRTTALIFTSPSNPTGAVYSEDEIRRIGEWAAEHRIWVISDEIYHDFVYEESRFVSISRFLPREQLIIVNGLAKSHVLTGWRLGWIVSTASVIDAVKNFQSHTTGNVSNISQRAALAAIRHGQDFPEQMRNVFDRRRRIAYELIRTFDKVRVSNPRGAFYVFPDVRALLDGTLRHGGEPVTTSLQLSRLLLEEIDVAVVPGEAFGAPGHLRFSYALDDAALVEGLERIRDFLAARSHPAGYAAVSSSASRIV
ncbi:aspartate aminotransferase [Microbacterium sp. W4I4]|uniref:pyridoxal phosphate-dependent aminotransferase n=1 Tax=Microbacterium sp. W4I4 TaxID=3042295 RepID=UPI00278626B7|nr:pyridoxal phosphate-dependent aminotransferase [Microbacterium sp. W4I4]MDQ0615753.1 aspartate aminotransferase [Microbacterium sp. W4I4]